MFRLLTATCFLFLSLTAISSQAQSSDSETDLAPWFQSNSFEVEDVSVLAPRRPRPTVYRCCSKPYATYGVMNCSQSTERLLAWSAAIRTCEYRYGKGNCVSGCRRLMTGQ